MMVLPNLVIGGEDQHHEKRDHLISITPLDFFLWAMSKTEVYLNEKNEIVSPDMFVTTRVVQINEIIIQIRLRLMR